MMSKTYIISGEVHSGKTTFAAGLSKRMEDNGLQVTGFVCPGTFKNNHRNAFDIEFLSSGKEMPFARNEQIDGWIKFRRFSFNPEVFHAGCKHLKSVENREETAVFLDEIGLWELEGGGWTEALNILMQKQNLLKIFVVRKKFITRVIEKFGLDKPTIFDIQNVSIDKAYEEIMSYRLTH